MMQAHMHLICIGLLLVAGPAGAAEPAQRVDALGDPLPEGALGTVKQLLEQLLTDWHDNCNVYFMTQGTVLVTVQQKFALLSPLMTERLRRRWAACEAQSLGRGGVTL